ncbi:hypothetical protein CHS0354_023931 [Potamilus streckersoni]|uniref:BIG2 domain-containing protein n=1 Tax=Potamilus streckersoni TaxID=2493646 RepID=A0AAE0RZ93_9BIVA|nr:hypothetical protein CHS0354_023931 [Potamilus streckersoni]
MPSNTTKEGYTFEGWYIDKEHKIAFANGNVTGNITLYAKWTTGGTTTGGTTTDGTTQFTITLNANGGNFSTTTNGSGTAPVTTKTIAIASGGTVPENTGLPTKAGSTISRWNTKADGSGTAFEFGTTTVTANDTIYAQWVEIGTINITVTLDANGGEFGKVIKQGISTSITTKTIDGFRNGQGVARSQFIDPTRDGYTLLGWNTKADGSGTEFVIDKTVLNATITIYAQWIETFTLTLDANGGEFGTKLKVKTITIKVEDGKTVTTPALLPTRANYKFKEWNTEANGSGTAFVFGTTKVTADMTIYAQWEDIRITSITLDKTTHTTLLGKTTQLTATILPENALKSVTWRSSNTAVATVSETGLITPVSAGSVNITATSTADNNKSATVAVTVRNYFYVPDANFASKLKYKDAVWITTIDGVNGLNIDAVSKFEGSLDIRSSNIASLQGIEYFTSLTTLNCIGNQLKTLDVSKNVNLTRLDCSVNQLQTLDVSKNVNLTGLDCYINQLQTLDVSKNVNLTTLYCSDNQLQTLDVSKNVNLTWLGCYNNQLQTLDVSGAVNLTGLSCSGNQLQTLDVSKNVNLTGLRCYNNQLQTLDVSKNVNLTGLDCSGNQLKTLDASKNVKLTWLRCYSNYLKSLDMRGMRSVNYLYITTAGENGGNSNSGLTSVKVHSSVATHKELKNAKNATGLQIDTYTAASGSTTYTQAICDFDPSTGLRASTARACTP